MPCRRASTRPIIRGWGFTAVARRLHGAEGAYRAEAGAQVFTVCGWVTLLGGPPD